MLIEKAWAKLHGSYCMIRQGSPSMVFPHLTGSPSVRFDHNYLENVDGLWQAIADADKRNYVITACTFETDLPWTAFSKEKKSDKRSEKKSTGIVSAHAYAVMSVHEVKHQGSRVKLLKLRNPWGESEWTGAWSDQSDKWDAKTKKQVKMEVADDGIFFIAFEDYVEHFRGTAISYESGFIDQEHPQPAYKAATIGYDFQEEEPDVEH